MIPSLYNKLGTTKIGDLIDTIGAMVTEERNGEFELELTYPATYPFSDSLVEENIIVADGNDTLKAQKFRIYMVKKFMSSQITVLARHISFDLAYDYINSINITNQSCQYCLNQLFRNSQFSTQYRGYSDIVNAQNYSVSQVNILSAIGGTKGSILDTFGTGAEILRDNTNIHVLNARGHDNGVTIEYKKNLTGFELEEDNTDLATRIQGYAKYTPEGGAETTVETGWIDSPLINNYSHPYCKRVDFSEQYQDGAIPTISNLTTKVNKKYTVDKVDIPKINYKIEFVPLSKAGITINDNITLCDKATIIDSRYGVNTQAKVIKVIFDVLRERYDSMELGAPKTRLSDIIGGGSGEDGKPGPPGPPGPPGQDGNVGDFPDSLPAIPVVTTKVYGFGSIEITWNFESKVYYTYEVYASKTNNFTPNAMDLIHEGQTSSFLFQAKPGETWYIKVCGKNSYGKRTAFSTQVSATTPLVTDLSNYVDSMAIGDALIGTLSFDRGWAGTLSANYFDAKNLSVTDGNGLRTLDIDSYGNVNLNVASLKIIGRNVATEDSVNAVAGAVENLDQANKDNAAGIEDIKNNGVSKVKNSIIDIGHHGVKVGRVGSEFENLQSETGNYMYSYGKEQARFDKDGFKTGYGVLERAQIGHLRFENGTDCQQIHYIEDLSIGGITFNEPMSRKVETYEGWEVN